MKAKEKAKELIDKYHSITGPFTETKQCAFIAVDEIINFLVTRTSSSRLLKDFQLQYWQEVKAEIEKL